MTRHDLPCRAEPETWFPLDEDGPSSARARAGCATCPVRAACLELGLTEPWGIWGGLSSAERRALRRVA